MPEPVEKLAEKLAILGLICGNRSSGAKVALILLALCGG